jgi:putative MFS transporter
VTGRSIAARLDRLPLTRTHVTATAIVGIGAFFDLFDIFLTGVLGTVLTGRFGLSELLLPAVLASSFLGMFFGSVIFGLLADRVGRRTAFLFNLGVYSMFTLAGALSLNAAMLIAARFIAGLGIGAETPLIDCYLGELLPARHRGRLTAWAYTIGFVGVPAVGILARILVPVAPLGVEGWRWLFVCGSAGGTIVWAVRRRLPESPRWLELHGRRDEADAIVSRMEREAGTTPDSPDSPVPGALAAAAKNPAVTPSPGNYRARAAMLCVFQICQTVGYYGFGTIVPLALAARGFSVITSLAYTSVTFVGYPVGSMLSIPLVERLDRRWLIAGAAFFMAVLGLALGFSSTAAAILSFGFLYTLVSNIFSNAFHIFQAEIFPTSIRATAAGSTYSLSRLSAAAMPFILLPVLRQQGSLAMFGVIAVAMLIVILTIGAFAPPTSGRALEEIAGGGDRSRTGGGPF